GEPHGAVGPERPADPLDPAGGRSALPDDGSVPAPEPATASDTGTWSNLRAGEVETPQVLTSHDRDQIQKLRSLAEQWGEPVRADPGAVTVRTVRHQALALVENLGLREGAPGAAARRDIVAQALSDSVRGPVQRVLADVGRPLAELPAGDRTFLAEIRHDGVANLFRMPLDTDEQLLACRRAVYEVRQDVTKTAADRDRAATEQLLLRVTEAENRVEWKLRSKLDGIGGIDSPARVVHERRRVLLVNLAWAGPGVGGSATVNRELAAALARQGHEVFVRVGHPASDWVPPPGVTLIGPRVHDPEIHPIYQLDMDLEILPDRIDTIIGHKDFSGFAARFIRNVCYPDAGLIHFLHLDDAASQAMQGRERLGQAIQFMNAELTAAADVVTGAGPVLAALAGKFAMTAEHPPVVHELIPGMEVTTQFVQPPLTGRPKVLLMGRLDSQHKGAHEAAQIARLVSERGGGIDLTLVGARQETLERSRQMLSDIAGQSVDVQPFTSNPVEKLNHLRSAHLLIMPSRIDAFGLMSLEALSAGLPPMAPKTTGFGRFLVERFPREISQKMVVEQDYAGPVPIERWADQIIEVTADVPLLWRRAAEGRAILQESNYTWDAAAEHLMNALPPAGRIRRPPRP
ncbi:MAG: glycosyltransferase family 4 protein, partial [Mycobacteriaceae bacterium]|nr:glycosyltransferase family 4 protein [Mycobacteriaceae bacterium]